MANNTSASSIIFQKTLSDLVKGIRSHKNNPTEYISQVIMECKQELHTTDPYLKSEAIRKLTYLQMVGYNISWASFAIVEVMSQNKFEHKRIGYLAANQSFTESTDVILLTTNLLKKEFTSSSSVSSSYSLSSSQQLQQHSFYDIGLALNCLANIATKDLARDCISDILHLLNHQRPYVRKKAIICLYKIYLKYPQGLRLTFDNLREKLDDADTSVVSCAVNVICELARKNPRNYLSMAPKFFQLLTTSSNNWMLIKVVKLMGSLVKEEPRLARKLLEPLATIIQNTSAKSLQYECISTITLALPFTKREDGSEAKNVPNILSLCVTQLQNLVKDEDPNLKYLGLVGFIQLMTSQPKIVMEQRDLILNCLNDEDITIRSKALELLSGIVTKKSLVDFVHQLLRHLRQAEGSYRDNIISTILDMGGLEKFSLVTDFIWYVSVLQRLACVQGGGATVGGLSGDNRPHHGKRVAEQLMDITLRVKTVRPFAVECMVTMLLDGGKLILGHARDTVAEVMMAAAWICGEYSDVLTSIMLDLKSDEDSGDEEAEEDDEGFWIEGPLGDEIRSKWRGKPVVVMTIACLLHPRSTNLPSRVQGAFLHAAMKIFIRSCDGRSSQEYLSQILALMRARLPVYLQSVHLEVQERASTLRYLLAETNILAVDAGLLLESKATNEDPNNGGDLLTFKDLEPEEGDDIELTQIRILSVDISGAAQAVRAYEYLRAIVGEEFYGVHPKAQRKVQVPDGLDLSIPFNKKAVEDLLAEESNEQEVNITTLCFTKPLSFSIPSHGQSQSAHSSSFSSFGSNDRLNDLNGLGQGYAYKSKETGSGNGSNAPPPSYSAASDRDKHQHRAGTDETFYLNSRQTQSGDRHSDEEDQESSQFTDGLQPIDSLSHPETRRRKKKSKTKKERKSGKKNREAEFVDIAPLGAINDSDSGDEKRIFRSHPGEDHDDYEDLENIDLTRPLRPEEALPVLRHRETAAAPSAGVANGVTGTRRTDEEEGGRNGREKKEKKKKEKKKKHRKGDEGVAAGSRGGGGTISDLLEMNFDSPSPSLISSAPAPAPGPSSKSKSKPLWLPFCSVPGSFDSSYSIESVIFNGQDIGQLFLLIRTFNQSAAAISLDLSISASSSGSYRLMPANHLSLTSSSVSASQETHQSIQLDLAPTINPLQNNSIDCILSLSTETSPLISTGGDTTRTFPAKISLSLPSFFQPHPVTESEFQGLVSNTSSTRQSLKIPISSRQGKSLNSKQSQKILKQLMKFLHGHLVESIEGSSATCCSSWRGNLICALLKLSADRESCVSVEIKCLGSDSKVTQQIGTETVRALSTLAPL